MEETSGHPEGCRGTVVDSGEGKADPEDPEDEDIDRGLDQASHAVDPASFTNLEASLERLLQRQRCEIMFELRRLQYDDRPVTGQDQRRKRRTVEGLVLRAAGGRPAPPRTQRRRRPEEDGVAAAAAGPSVVSRPEHVVVEVNALVERRPVSSVLDSVQFRRRLEDSVRGALETMRAGGGRRNATRTTVSAPRSNLDSPNAATAAGETVAMETEPEVLPQPTLVPGHAPDNSTGSATRAEEWIQQHVTLSTDPEFTRQRMTTELLDRLYHEEFVMEISDLIHRQLVTSALNGSFRDVLERRMRRHVDVSGIDGARVQEQLRQLPRSTAHLRNDFVDLGIIPGIGAAAAAAAGVGDVGDAVDDVSVISATAAVALPQVYAQNNVAMIREMRGLRTEIEELKNMMRLTFDLQLDLQRSIRQEVAAALAQSPGDSSFPLPSASIAADRAATGSSERCLICDDHCVDTVLYQCGHLCLCYACAMNLRQSGSNCPVCRAPIRDIMRTYRP